MTLRPNRLVLAAALAVLAAGTAAPLFAGAQARIVGTVTDGKGTPLEDVTVTITTSAFNFKVVLKTDKKGSWGTILNDSTVKYHYKFEKKGCMTVEQDKKVPVTQTETLDVQLFTQEQAVEKGIVKQTVDPFTAAFNDAVDKLKANDFDGAAAKAAEAMKLGPEKAIAFDLGAKIARSKSDNEHVIEYGERSLQLEPDNSSLYGLLAEAYKAKGNKEKAKEYEKKFNAANPDQPDVLYNQAVDLYNKNDFKGAEPILQKVVEAKPDYASAHFLLGMCDVNLNKIPDMKKHLSEYIRLEPKGKDVSTAKEMLDAFK